MNTKNLLTDYRRKEKQVKAQYLNFHGVEEKDVYNITAPFELDGKTVIAGRIESRDTEYSIIGLFENTEKDDWNLMKEAVTLELQDPFVTIIDGKVIIGGVEVFFEEDGAKWRTVFYHLTHLNMANKLFEGPLGMKDLRLKKIANDKILILTRPQGEKGGRGKIGVTFIKDLEELTIEKIEEAPLLKNQFIDEEWGGANEIHVVNENVYVLGHIANFDEEGNRHYYAMTFELNEAFDTMLNPQIIAERRDFLPGPSKRPDLEDVVFSGGLVLENEEATLYAGISDAAAQKLKIDNPFK